MCIRDSAQARDLWPRHLSGAKGRRTCGGGRHERAEGGLSGGPHSGWTETTRERTAITLASGGQLAIDGTLVGIPPLHTGRSTPARERADPWDMAGMRASPQWGAAGSHHGSDDHRRLVWLNQRRRTASTVPLGPIHQGVPINSIPAQKNGLATPLIRRRRCEVVRSVSNGSGPSPTT